MGEADASAVKAIAAIIGLISQSTQKLPDSCPWIIGVTKSTQLRMVHVTAGLPSEYFLGKESFSPRPQQAGPVEETRVK